MATRTISMRPAHTPGWIWVLLLFGILPFVVAYAFTKREVRIEIPASTKVAEQRFRVFASMWAALAVSAALVIVSLLTRSPAFAWVGATVFVITVMALPFGSRVWIDARYDGEVVLLNRVHPNYVQALGRSAVP